MISSTQPQYTKKLNAKGVEYAYTRVNKKHISLGRYGTEESMRRFERIVDDWRVMQRASTCHTSDVFLTVGELAERYLIFEEARVAEGKVNPRQIYAVKYAVLALIRDHAQLPTHRFGPKSLTEIQERLSLTACVSKRGDHANGNTLSRTEVNRRINHIRHIFKWGIREELVRPEILDALKVVPGLRSGEARDNPKRQPADPVVVDQTIEELHKTGNHGMAWAIVLLRWTGCRPDEACSLRVDDVVLNLESPMLKIRNHKTRKITGEDRVVPLNPMAVAALKQALGTSASLSPDQHVFLSTKGRPFTPSGLLQAVKKATRRAGLPHWFPYQLRHLTATEVIANTGSETAAAALLGHSPSSTMIRRYSTNRIGQAARGARSLGEAS